jgi:formate/nitrite transporter FocA (FNT family)
MSHTARSIAGPGSNPVGDRRYLRLDTKAIVAGVMLGIVMVLVQQVTSRIDVALTGGSFSIIGGITWATVSGLSALLFRQPAGLITGEIQALIGLLTASSPLAPTFFLSNGLGPLAYTWVATQRRMDTWLDHFLAQLAQNLVGNVMVALALLFILHLPITVVLLSIVVTGGLGAIGSTLLTKPLAESVARSGVAD